MPSDMPTYKSKLCFAGTHDVVTQSDPFWYCNMRVYVVAYDRTRTLDGISVTTVPGGPPQLLLRPVDLGLEWRTMH